MDARVLRSAPSKEALPATPPGLNLAWQLAHRLQVLPMRVLLAGDSRADTWIVHVEDFSVSIRNEVLSVQRHDKNIGHTDSVSAAAAIIDKMRGKRKPRKNQQAPGIFDLHRRALKLHMTT